MKSNLLTLTVIGFLVGAMVVASASVASSQSSAVNDEVINAQKNNQDAQAAYYRKQLEDKTFLQKVGDNPAAVGAVVAALVALLSLLVNYLATLRNQTDTQFYEAEVAGPTVAMKRFGDTESPTLRSSAAGILCQMGQSRTATVRFRPPFLWRYPYFRTAFDQLITGSLVENDRIALRATQSALFELVSARRRLAHAALLTVNDSLQLDLLRSLADFFISKGSTLTGTNAVWDEIDPEYWMQASVITGYKEPALKYLAWHYPEQFSDFLNRELLSSQMLNEKQKKKQSMAAVTSLQRVAESLRTNGSLFGSSFKQKILTVSVISLFPSMRRITFGRLFPRNTRGMRFYPSAYLVGASLSFIHLKRIWFYESRLDELVLAYTRLLDVNLREASLEGASLIETRMFNVDLSQAKLSNAKLLDARLYSVDLSRADLQGADFRSASLQDVDMKDVSFFGDANFGQAQLDNVSFAPKAVLGSPADLRGVNFQFAKLDRVDFSRALVSGACFYGASVTKRTDFAGVDWWRADFSHEGSIDETLLQALYARYGEAIPNDIDIEADVHASVQHFLRAVTQSDRNVEDSQT